MEGRGGGERWEGGGVGCGVGWGEDASLVPLAVDSFLIILLLCYRQTIRAFGAWLISSAKSGPLRLK